MPLITSNACPFTKIIESADAAQKVSDCYFDSKKMMIPSNRIKDTIRSGQGQGSQLDPNGLLRLIIDYEYLLYQ